MSSGWLLDTAVCHPDDISYHRMSSGWLSRNRYLIRMSYDNVIMSSGWHRLPFLSHPDEIVNFDFPHHAVALQRFRTGAISPSAAETRIFRVNQIHTDPCPLVGNTSTNCTISMSRMIKKKIKKWFMFLQMNSVRQGMKIGDYSGYLHGVSVSHLSSM